MTKPTIILIGGGAAGLWTAMSLLEKGWNGQSLTIVEPFGKTEDDRTWSYWARKSLLPASVEQQEFSRLLVAADGKRRTYELKAFRYFSVRSSKFYAYAKEVLAKAGVRWISQKAVSVSENAQGVSVFLEDESSILAAYVLDSRPPTVEVPSRRFNVTLQHFGGWFVKMEKPVFDVEQVVFMDFVEIDEGVAFFYVIPSSASEALVEIAVFSESPWEKEKYDAEIAAYILKQYGTKPSDILEREYGVIPMTDQPLWRGSTARVWNIGTRGGWVQPSSGYAFTRTAKFAKQVASALDHAHPQPWTPSAVQQIFNSVMLGYIIDNPREAGSVFYNLFAKNGTERTFSFLDESSSFNQTIRLMWNSPRFPFAVRAVKETIDRLKRVK